MGRSTVLTAIAISMLTAVIAVAPAYAQAGRGTRVAAPTRIDAIRSGLTRHLGMRPTVRNAIATERHQVKLGLISSAATSVTQTRAAVQPMGLRERLALWNSKRNVTRTAFRLADQRSRAGDTVGTRDALDGLGTLQAPGRAGAEKRAFNNAIYVAKRAAGKRSIVEVIRRTHNEMAGDLDLANDNLNFAAELKKNDRKVLRTARTIMKGGFKLAAKYAKAGNPDVAWQLLEKSAIAANRGRLEFPEPTARRILVQAFEVHAGQAYKAGAHDAAAASLYQALAIQRSLGERPNRTARKLQQKLMPRIRALEEAQQAAETAEPEPADADTTETVASSQE